MMGITAVWGPPRSGKSTLAIDLAFALSRHGQSVCLISPELFSELSARLNINITKQKSLFAAYRSSGNPKQTVCPVDDLLFVLAAPTYTDAFSEDVTGPEAKALFAQTVPMFDFVLVDCPSHTGSAIAAWALNQADTVVLLTGFSSSAGLWHNAYRRATEAVAQRSLPVCVQGSDSFDYRSLHSLIHTDPAVWLPNYPDAETVQALRRTLYDSGGKTGRTYSAAVDEICSRLKGGARK